MKLFNALTAATLLVVSCSVDSAHASNGEKFNAPVMKDVPAQKWTFINETHGIRASLSIADIKGERFLSIQLENTTSEDLKLILSLTKNNETVIITQDEMSEAYIQLNAESTHILDGTYLIYLSEEDQISDFNITINPTK
ncbi:MAG: hypothetical protein ACFHU9_13595 [Fluviicola sp.]